ncbi:TPA: ABC transporter ATP-binding protein [Streptococcus pyogenes]|jgi:ABC transported MDR-type, ATPase component|uniref:ABC-type transporter ATP-binding protein EcsA n=1 Tax=Anaerococcus octavius TaxID=54007 RepID=A0A2I1M8E1_9FIRM|nr:MULTISPECIES: ATP-binding cassette domain-containing protein [Bacillota]HEN0880093.1 ATP-binding cassette domain-containing protein [Streptococcus agalactiae]HEQ2365854.1 ATP-binding cassette domain-containing protein [Streptococcus pyogenes]MBS6106046.1 ATP-binding cassette domain-containing protein [Anaerococcus sp.]MDU3177714.1 ATP-binding cassette domain-containing protein [Anaerococcus sp.]MDU6824341.1 ATP-binding cassette domain-containing protein [Intestinibacter bartlettii]
MNYLQITNLTKSYGETIILDNVNLSIDSGEIVGLLGRNGAGKSTLMKCIVGLVRKDYGKIKFNGVVSNKFGYLIEYPAFYPNLSAYDNLKIFASILNVCDKRIKDIIDIVGLTKHGDKIFANYSLGMKQRLGLGRVLLTDPDLLILDEPFNGLDPSGVIEIRGLLKELAKSGKSILISSHNLPEIERIVDQINLIHNTKIVKSVNINEVHKEKRLVIKSKDSEKIMGILKKHKLSQNYLLDENAIRIEGNDINSEMIIQLIYSNGGRISEIYFEKTTLEEYFEEIVGDIYEEIK